MRFLLAMSIALIGTGAAAQCRTDIECKGERVCVQGSCVDPVPPSAEADVTKAAPPSSTGRFSKAMGIVVYVYGGGMFFAALAGGTALGIAFSSRDSMWVAFTAWPIAWNTLSLAVSALVLTASSTSRTGSVTGSPGARYAGIGLVAASLVPTVVTSVIGSKAESSLWGAALAMCIITTTMQALGVVLLGVDAFSSGSQAASAPPSTPSIAITPLVFPNNSGGGLAVVGGF